MFDLPERTPILVEELRAWRAGHCAASGVEVRECATRAVLQMEARSMLELERILKHLPPPNRHHVFDDIVLCRVGPVTVLALSDGLAPPELEKALEIGSDQGQLSLTDISHGVVYLEFVGAPVRQVLSGLVTADFRQGGFSAGGCLKTVLSGHSVLARCLDDETFEIQVDRSLCLSLWQRMEVALKRLL